MTNYDERAHRATCRASANEADWSSRHGDHAHVRSRPTARAGRQVLLVCCCVQVQTRTHTHALARLLSRLRARPAAIKVGYWYGGLGAPYLSRCISVLRVWGSRVLLHFWHVSNTEIGRTMVFSGVLKEAHKAPQRGSGIDSCKRLNASFSFQRATYFSGYMESC